MWRCRKNRDDCYALFSNKNVIIFDTETTGLKPEKDTIIEIGAWKVNPDSKGFFHIVNHLSVFIKPPKKVSKKIEELTSLTNSFLFLQETEDEVFDSIFNFFGSHPIIGGYNTSFDVGFMKALYKRHHESFEPLIIADALEMARDLVSKKETDNYKLQTMVSLYGLDVGLSFHRAIDDARGTARLFQALFDEYKKTEIVNGSSNPWIKTMWIWEGYNHMQKRLVVRTNYGDVFYSFHHMAWDSKENPDFYKQIDMESFQKKVLLRLGIEDVNQIRKLKPEMVRESENNYFKKVKEGAV